jgi:PAS domain S-box-containing protein
VSATRRAVTWWRQVLGGTTRDDRDDADASAVGRDAVGAMLDDLAFQQVFEHIVDSELVVLVDGDGRIRFASRAVVDLLGRRPEQVHGESIAALMHEADLDRFRLLTDIRNPEDPQAAPVHVRLRAADGRWRTLEWVISIPRSTEPGVAVLTGHVVSRRIELPAELPPEPRRESQPVPRPAQPRPVLPPEQQPAPQDTLTDLPGS